jgi:hypothetical protein
MAGERTFVVKFISDTASAKAGLKLLSGDIKGFGKEVGKTSPLFSAIAVGATAAFGAVAVGLTKAVKAAMEDQASQAELQRQLEKTFGANEALTASAERYVSVTQLRTGTSDTELRSSLGTLVRATGDLQKSTSLLNLAQDISAATGKDLATVSLALAKSSQGQFTALAKLGIPLDENIKKSKDFGKVIELLNGQFGGAAATSANTFGGQLKILQGQFGEILETVGAALLPYLQRFSEFLVNNVAPAIQRVTTVIGEKGLLAGFQQLLFESGGAGKAIISTLKAITVAFALAINVISPFIYLTRAAWRAATNDFSGAWDDIKSSLKERIPIAPLMKQFDDFGTSINHYKLNIRDTINQQTNFKGSLTDVSETLGGGGKSVSKTLKTATEKLKEYSNSLKSSTSLQKGFTKAQKDTKDAQNDLAQSNTDVIAAQAALDRAVSGFGAGSPEAVAAQKELDKAQRGVERAGYRVEQSLFAVTDAEKALADVRADPESTPQAIREAEIALAEAKLSTKDAIDEQKDSTDGLIESQSYLNELVSGAIVGSAFYAKYSDALTEAQKRQTDAQEKLAEAKDREAEAQERLNEAMQKTADLIALYPKVLGGMPNPMAISTGAQTLVDYSDPLGVNAVTSGLTFNINAGLGASGIQVGQEIDQYLREYLGFTGKEFSFGSIGTL